MAHVCEFSLRLLLKESRKVAHCQKQTIGAAPITIIAPVRVTIASKTKNKATRNNLYTKF